MPKPVPCIPLILGLLLLLASACGRPDWHSLLEQQAYSDILASARHEPPGRLYQPAAGKAYLAALVYTGDIPGALSFFRRYSRRSAPDADMRYLFQIARILEVCGQYFKPKGINKLLKGHALPVTIRATAGDMAAFRQAALRYQAHNALLQDHATAILRQTLLAAPKRKQLVRECLGHPDAFWVNLAVSVLSPAEAKSQHTRLLSLLDRPGMDTARLVFLLKDAHKQQVLDLVRDRVQEDMPARETAALVLGLRGLPLKDVLPVLSACLERDNQALHLAGLGLLKSYVNHAKALELFIRQATKRFTHALFPAYRSMVYALNKPSFTRLAGRMADLPPEVRALLFTRAAAEPRLADSVIPFLSAGGDPAHALWLAMLRPTTRSSAGPGELVLLVSIDTLRKDHLACYGYPRQTAPFLHQRLKRQGIRFDNVYATSPWTLPSHVSMLTGLSAVDHQVNQPGDIIPGSLAYLPQVLRDQGYFTMAFVSHFFVSQDHNFDRGFDLFCCMSEIPARDLLRHAEHALRALPQGQNKVFLFVHLYDCHSPYTPAKEADLFHDSPPYAVPGNPLINEQQNRYDGEILYVDACLEGFLNRLPAAPAWLIITSDHGEEFLDHGGVLHGTTLYNEVVQVPLFVWTREPLPGLWEKRGALTTIQDIPYLLCDGLDLAFPVPRQPPGAAELLVSRRSLRKIGWVEDTRKWTYDMGRNRLSVFDLIRDPKEKRPFQGVWAHRPGQSLWQRKDKLQVNRPADRRYLEDQEKRLRALGYVN